MIDPRNAKALANHQVWLPFHFLPGNAGLRADQKHEGKFVEKIICRPDSPISREMVRDVIENRDRSYGLHRLGVAMHVYADTWAHQGFAGVLHEVNEVEDAKDNNTEGGLLDVLKNLFNDVLDDAIPPLGHGRANIFPDLPFLSWSYKNYKGEQVSRNNTELFCNAADELCKAMQCFRAGSPDANVPGLGDNDKSEIKNLFLAAKEDDGEKRHQAWLGAIADGKFSFGAEELTYTSRGKASWKHQALGTSYDMDVHTYKDDFLQSNWKYFHDAILAHRFYVVHDLLPKYGICAA